MWKIHHYFPHMHDFISSTFFFSALVQLESFGSGYLCMASILIYKYFFIYWEIFSLFAKYWFMVVFWSWVYFLTKITLRHVRLWLALSLRSALELFMSSVENVQLLQNIEVHAVERWDGTKLHYRTIWIITNIHINW